MAEHQFKVGDKAVYPAQGVGVVTGIESKEISGNREVFYVLKLLGSDRKIMVPMSKASKVGLRSVIPQDMAQKVYEVLKEVPKHRQRLNWNRRYRGYIEKLKSGSVFDVAEVLRDLYVVKRNSGLSFGEKRLLETARDLLVKELSVANAEPEESVEQKIFKTLEDTSKEFSPK